MVIGEGAYVSSNAVLYHGVTLGRKRQIVGNDADDGFPYLENNVVIGAGAKLVGNLRIGSNSIIGPNVVLMKSVPNNSIVKVQEPIVKTK